VSHFLASLLSLYYLYLISSFIFPFIFSAPLLFLFLHLFYHSGAPFIPLANFLPSLMFFPSHFICLLCYHSPCYSLAAADESLLVFHIQGMEHCIFSEHNRNLLLFICKCSSFDLHNDSDLISLLACIFSFILSHILCRHSEE
jgi:hypothetical protein